MTEAILQTIINSTNPVRITNQKIGLSRSPRCTPGGTKCLGEVNIPCQPVTPTVNPISVSGKWNNPQSKSACQGQSNIWYKTYQTTFDPKGGCAGKPNPYNDNFCGMLFENEIAETPVTSKNLTK
jgi:hypothetical protein